MNKEELENIESFAASFLTPEEVAIVMQLNDDLIDKLKMPETEEGKAFARGRLKMKAKVYTKIIALAQEGSVPAQEMALKIIQNSNSD